VADTFYQTTSYFFRRKGITTLFLMSFNVKKGLYGMEGYQKAGRGSLCFIIKEGPLGPETSRFPFLYVPLLDCSLQHLYLQPQSLRLQPISVCKQKQEGHNSHGIIIVLLKSLLPLGLLQSGRSNVTALVQREEIQKLQGHKNLLGFVPRS
jgi:hypothetical protein